MLCVQCLCLGQDCCSRAYSVLGSSPRLSSTTAVEFALCSVPSLYVLQQQCSLLRAPCLWYRRRACSVLRASVPQPGAREKKISCSRACFMLTQSISLPPRAPGRVAPCTAVRFCRTAAWLRKMRRSSTPLTKRLPIFNSW